LDITLDRALEALLFLAALIASISVHEFGHAWMATKLGDPLPAAQGRLTLSPVRHIDPIGTILFPLVMFFTHLPLLGWGRPVQTDRSSYTRRVSPALGHLLVALAGPLMNLVLAVVVSLLLLAGARAGVLSAGLFYRLFQGLVGLNLLLLFLNLLPVPPLDGGAVLEAVLPRSLQYVVRFLERWGFVLLLGLSFLTNVFRTLLAPARWVEDAWLSWLFRVAGL
jgi:Zn-dependent protease